MALSRRYAASGALNITVVSDGTTLTGVNAPDGSIYVSLSDGTNRGLYAKGGSIRVTVASADAAHSRQYAPDGSWYVTSTKGSPAGAVFVNVVSGTLTPGGGTGSLFGLAGLFGNWS